MVPRYHIDTIPVWDALQKQSECLLCILRRRTEHLLADRYLGGSVMEPITRIRVNDKGFCSEHQKMLFARQNKLGHALMMLSHIKEIQNKLDAFQLPKKEKTKTSFFHFRGIKTAKENSDLHNLMNTCVICNQLNENMKRYAYTIFHLWKNDKSFQEAFISSKGLCLPDCELLFEMSPNYLSGHFLILFEETLIRQLRENLSRLEAELDWFTQKFDYRNSDKPWNASKDALERSINKLRGWSVGKDPGTEE